ncbi:Ppx/GppA phosphatase family protein [Runella slithyformis]|uniref:Ppx/GppA phosphatase n=1 Tax=Runella slithyformis (strain ATCC 29530 / DSM 19594 / LMG 11500 / NCIMB 11436 / LSU 4) TaxID=761193 RepID=A0A7U3ZLQ6_RUNSL|nr:phosphatase [Runella slithyformis]AEI49525.1 Ppx/GppA phosphatase [Runella slithyformis DSM 19594]
MKYAIIDLGTNTFHLLIVEKTSEGVQPVFKAQTPAKIGKAGINQGIITEEAIQRAVNVLKQFRQKINEFGVEPAQTKAIGTSAIRNAKNEADFCTTVKKETQITIEVISGDREAELIYRGVRQGIDLGPQMSVIMDIGGGSVEFIICNASRIFWKHSFEIGGQRLLEQFVLTDPISPSAIQRMHTFFQEQLLPLVNAAHQYAPQVLVGSSGSFDTLVDMDFMHRYGHLPDPAQTHFEISTAEFYRAYHLLTTQNHDERMKIPGMIELRVDMIVPGVVLIDHVLRSLNIPQIRSSTYALKEGIMEWVVGEE